MLSFRLVFLLAVTFHMAEGHGRLMVPPSRSSMWRFGYNNSQNFNDNQLFCGGASTQYELNGGKCGVCGDPWNGPLENQPSPSNIYAKDLIVGRYEVGQVIQTYVELTANHKGWFQFKLCQNDEKGAHVTQECFDKHVLENLEGDTQLTVGLNPGCYNHTVKLPAGVSCKRCILQWRYHAANSWGVDANGKGCMGCGNQEEFYGCSDIAIGVDSPISPVKPSWRPSEVGCGGVYWASKLGNVQSPNNGWTPDNGQTQGPGQSTTTGQAGCNCPCAHASGSAIVNVNTSCLFLFSIVLAMLYVF